MNTDLKNNMVAWRHHLHAHPELSRQEQATAAFVTKTMGELGIKHEGRIGGHGVVGTLSRGAGNAVGLRADMDALPIIETTGKPYASKTPGVMHACGHDGHTASLLGAAKLLSEDQSWSGTINFVFQPAEEGFAGAHAMVDDGLFKRFPMQRMFGYHNWPGLEAGTIMLHPGAVMAGAANFRITLRGVAGHAAMPHLCVDPVQGVAHLIIALNSIAARTSDPLETAVVSTCVLRAGEANNQIPDHAVLGGTFRALNPKVMAYIEERITHLAHNVAATHGLRAEIEIFGRLSATSNTRAESDLAAVAASTLGRPVRRDMAPTMGAEDFGRFLEEVPGAYAWIGNGPSAGLHHPEFDYNDDILLIAAQFFVATAKAAL